MSGWAFKTDEQALTAAQRERVKREILSLIDSSTKSHEEATIRSIAEKVGRAG
jgi:hypothetical protein